MLKFLDFFLPFYIK